MVVLISYLLIIVLVLVLFYASYILYKKAANSLKVDPSERTSEQFTSNNIIDPTNKSQFAGK